MLATLTLCSNSNWIEQALAHAVLDLQAEVKRLEGERDAAREQVQGVRV